ncbi:hypothetical protein EX30DRAFT_365761 [Ascodesmis nigricans]|uniref:Uncharacterized protein n=1 Tax=Ascodesmis nigricans TaxID=341454 RepID=A0A4S2MNZ7_9PEZI|nr:hypothetical protein EX30DRAFT_365761 [Ascodesmis nigricans]
MFESVILSSDSNDTIRNAVGVVRWEGCEFTAPGDRGSLAFATFAEPSGVEVHIPVELHIRAAPEVQTWDFLLLSVFVGVAEEFLDVDLLFVHAQRHPIVPKVERISCTGEPDAMTIGLGGKNGALDRLQTFFAVGVYVITLHCESLLSLPPPQVQISRKTLVLDLDPTPSRYARSSTQSKSFCHQLMTDIIFLLTPDSQYPHRFRKVRSGSALSAHLPVPGFPTRTPTALRKYPTEETNRPTDWQPIDSDAGVSVVLFQDAGRGFGVTASMSRYHSTMGWDMAAREIPRPVMDHTCLDYGLGGLGGLGGREDGREGGREGGRERA